jgi:cation transport regulator ChaC
VRTGSGVADVIADPGSLVWGVLYELRDEELATLDAKEGAGWAYERREMRVYADDSSPVDAVVYVVIEKSPEAVPPSDEYAQRLIEAASERSLPGDYVEALARVVAAGDAPAP